MKIVFPTDPTQWHRKTAERMWAKPLSEKTFVIENSPLYALGVSYKDVVSAEKDANGDLVFRAVECRGGRSTYQLVLESGKTKEHFQVYWQPIEALGCTYESSLDPEVEFAVDVPPEVDVDAVYALLERGERDGIWEFGEGHREHVALKGSRN